MKQPKSKKLRLNTVLIVIFALGFLIGGISLIRYSLQSRDQEQDYDQLASILASLQASAPSRPIPTPPPSTVPSVPGDTTSATTAPTVPTVPSVPTEPTNPTVPSAPTEPTVPTSPTDPTEPTAPTQPTVPPVTETLPPPTQAPTQAPTEAVPETRPSVDRPSNVQHPNTSVMLPEYLHFYNLNQDTVGWISIPDTKINYPVMQTPDRRDYYLKRNFNKESSQWGAIYVRESCDVFQPSDNQTIYGHCMNDGSMFAGLLKYWDKNYWETHRYIYYDTLYEYHTYEIFAVFKTSANPGQGFSYHKFENAATEEEFNSYVSTVKSLAFFNTGITPVYGEKLITLSTCEYTLDNGRMVVVARRIY